MLRGSPGCHPPDHDYLTCNLHLRFAYLGCPEDLEMAVKYADEAVAAMSTLLFIRYRRLRNIDELNSGIQLLDGVIPIAQASYITRHVLVCHLTLQFGTRYELLGDLEDLESSFKHGRELLAAMPLNHPDRVRVQLAFSMNLAQRFRRLGVMGDLTRAIQLSEQATHSDLEMRVCRLDNLSVLLFLRFEQRRNPEDLRLGIKNAEEAISLTPVGHIFLPNLQLRLGNLLAQRYTQVGQQDDLEVGIHWFERAREAIPLTGPLRYGPVNAEIAYLSACSTAVNAVDLLQDECIHIASAFQLAGFSHVLATL